MDFEAWEGLEVGWAVQEIWPYKLLGNFNNWQQLLGRVKLSY